MLSRVAERIYWLARLMERAENTARLVNVYSTLLLDLPAGSKVGWETLLNITGSNELFFEIFQKAEEASVSKFLLVQKNNPGSILSALTTARENARTTREIIPSEAWELINNTYLFAKNNAGMAKSRSGRLEFLKTVIAASQQLTGLLTGSMSHNAAYDFGVIGRNLERADMTSRIIDVGAAALMQQSKDGIDFLPYENVLWMNVLRSMSAYQMYRQHVQNRVNGKDVVQFLLLNQEFPRAVLHCLERLSAAASKLPNNEDCLRTVASVLRRIREVNIEKMLEENTLYDYIDQLQLEFVTIHNNLASIWFLTEPDLSYQEALKSAS